MISGMGLQRQRWLQVAAFWLTLVVPSISQATGFRIMPQSASGAGQADAFVAQSDDPSAIYYNPAGITQLPGVQLMMGALMVGGYTHFTNRATGAKSSGDLDGPVSNPLPLHVYLTANLKPLAHTLDLPALARTTVGVGVFSSFGLRNRWPEDGPLSTSLTFASLPLLDIRPVIAYKVNEQLSLAAGADVYTFASFMGEGGGVTKFHSSGAPGLPPRGTPLEVNGNDTTPGFNLSLRYTPCLLEGTRPWCSFGFQYRSRATLHLEGEFLDAGMTLTSARTKFVIPQSFTFGMAVWPLLARGHEWKVEVDLDKTDWSSFRNTDVHLGTGKVIPVPRNWSNTLTFMVGTEYKWIDPAALLHWDMTTRAGWQHSATPVPSQTFDPAVPDSDKNILSVGMGFLCKAGGYFAGFIPCGEQGGWYRPSAISLDVAYQAGIYDTRHIDDNKPPLTLPAVVNGRYSTIHHAGFVTLGIKF
ncbi:outer membrane protein transport protein [Candidatus Methylomirabilis sp.]|uniref:OmpP1/FadL family transporter n=1 Tax=Candidatus Methylomirabilis sp. TaxID=2032687 RepID=UPI002A640072|nr:outer membrane protein transport protein [Candidatus Methylomirabilis sp.]